MSRIARLLPSFVAGRRAYSFFSSKPPGGRYFNSAKAPKVVSPAGAGKNNRPVDSSTPAEHAEANEELRSQAAVPLNESPEDTGRSPHPPIHALPMLPHPSLRSHELKLHNLFSLHRPLLLLHQPISSLFDLPPHASTHSSGTIDNPPEASPEADADAARQLSRALVINRVGNAVNWDHTLQRLGCEMDLEKQQTGDSASWDASVLLDSTKRKKRKKMKKHKLKKRRRLQRATRLRLGK